jgi:hypothetical protein
VLYSFNDTLGSSPTGNLTLCPNGKLYGTTEEDETGNGVLFSFEPLGNKYQVEFTFDYINGSSPFGSLAFATKPEVAAVNEVAQAEKISVYPNPTSTYVNIDFKEAGVHFIELINVAGQKIVQVQSTEKTYQLSCPNYTPGMYFLNVYDKEMNYISTEKILIN